ncbi:Cytochrome b559 subunit alpha [Platanthera zijinensis]|uniref:Cytochrome b559 subunit alpha n=1 Tax=Platanthera zijinensis TaxID=2320716 RepID=A0AAP0BK35_9ASPA
MGKESGPCLSPSVADHLLGPATDRYWVIHSITIPSLFIAGWLFVSTGRSPMEKERWDHYISKGFKAMHPPSCLLPLLCMLLLPKRWRPP